ncbi:hypothetical protein HN385_00045 [archaeon]|jgi:hypothetical protein|nr:hypothetical protein [archaeon]MBT3451195.1 hypothetical protein [archaeon]MBT6869017.1 hypothetical protein [archaeon]MBT7193605.1 hypothetical protein [archaeon]MBT7380138.1 hypothetical protein [archaeon]
MNNKKIVALLGLALIVSLTGTIISVSEISNIRGQWMVIGGAVTSNATSTGNTTLEILSNVGLQVHDSEMDLGSGYVNSSAILGSIDTLAGANNWLNSTGQTPVINNVGHTLNNTGSSPVNVTIQVTSHTNAEHWLCNDAGGSSCPGDNAFLDVKALEGPESNSCIGAGEQNEWTSLMGYNNQTTVLLCPVLMPVDSNDELITYYKFGIPQEAPTGTKTVFVQFTAEAV